MFPKEFLECMLNEENILVVRVIKETKLLMYTDTYKKTLLHFSAAYGNVELTEYLIRSGLPVDSTDEDGNTPLLLAIYFQHIWVIQSLINAGADLCKKNAHGRSPAFYANMDGNVYIEDIIKAATDSGKVDETRINEIFADANWDERIESVRHLFIEGMMHYGIHLYKTKLFHSDEENYFEISILKEFPLMRSIFRRDIHQIRLNLKYGVAASLEDGYCCTPLLAAATIFQEAEEVNQVIELLIEYGADVNDKNSKGVTALHVATAYCNFEFIKALLKRNADVNAKDAKGRTPLYSLFIDSHTNILKMRKVLKLLLKSRIDINTCPPGLKTIWEKPVMMAKPSIRKMMMKVLVKKETRGTEISAQNMQAIQKFDQLKMCYDECKNEVEKMKNVKILGSVTMFDMFTQLVNQVSVYAKNKRFVRRFNAFNKKKNFPIFYRSLRRSFKKGFKKTNLQKLAAVVLADCLPSVTANHPVTQTIVSYLRRSELQNLCKYAKK